MDELLKISALGGLTIQHNERIITTFVSHKVDALLLYLACENRAHQRESLIDFLWDDVSQERAMANLRKVISSLQQELGPFITVTRKTVSINPDSHWWLDVAEMESVINEAERQASSYGGLSGSTAASLEKALALYKGDFLAGFHVRSCRGFEGWMLLQQERLRGRVTTAFQRLIDYSLEHSAYSAGIAHGSQLVKIDPLDESAHRKLMLLFVRAGRRSAALAQYETCCRILQEQLDIDPDEETVALYQELQEGKSVNVSESAVSTSPAHNLLAELTPFVDRPSELAQLAKCLDNPTCRLLTLVGLGGIGKTRLALQAGAERLDHFINGVFFIPLASISSPDFLPSTVATILKISLQSEKKPLEQLLEYLQNKQMLLIMDNFEHLLDGTLIVAEMLARGRNIKIIATSREPLNIAGEWILNIDGLRYPESDRVEDPEYYNAIQLFVQTASRLQPDFSFAENNVAVIRICQLVEGMPLGIELAAAWVRRMSCAEISANLEGSLDVLVTPLRNIPERHRTMRLAFEHSWNLLPSLEREALLKLSVFRGGFDLEAAQEVAGASQLLLMALAEKSLVRRVGSDRYDMHELLRRYTGEKLLQSGLAHPTRNDHLTYYLNLAERAKSTLSGPEQAQWLDRVRVETDNFWESLTWVLDSENLDVSLQLGALLALFWLRQGPVGDGLGWLERILAKTTHIQSVTRAQALHRAAYLAWMQGDYPKAESYSRESLAICETLDDKLNIAWALSMLGMLAWTRGENGEAQVFYRQCLAVRREMDLTLEVPGTIQNVASTLLNLGNALHYGGEYAEALKAFEESLTLYRKLGNLTGIADGLLNLGDLANAMGDFPRAQTLTEESLALYARLGSKERGVSLARRNLGETALGQGDYRRAHQLFDEYLLIRQEAGAIQPIAGSLMDLGYTALGEGDLDQAKTFAEESKRLLDSIGDRRKQARCLNLLGNVCLKRGNFEAARQWFAESLAVGNKQGNKREILIALNGVAQLACVAARFSEAVTLFACIDARCREVGIRFPFWDRADYERGLSVARSALAPVLFDAAWIEGQGLTLEQAIRFANSKCNNEGLLSRAQN